MKENEKSFGFLAHESVAQQSFKLASMGTSEWVTQELFAGHSSLFSGIRQLHFFFFFAAGRKRQQKNTALCILVFQPPLYSSFFFILNRGVTVGDESPGDQTTLVGGI